MRFPTSVRILAERLAGKSIFETKHYRESELTRLLNLFARVDVERWRGLRVLEVGAGLGHLGDAFSQLGFDVTSSDGRAEHVEEMRRRGRQAFVLDLDTTSVEDVGEFDLILAFGVLYHLAHPKEFLLGCGKGARVLLLETAVCDRKDPVIEWVTEPRGWRGKDQALHARACRPSPAWVEEACREAGFSSIRDISSPLGNWSIGSFDWEPQDTGATRRGPANLRKMWVCERES